MNVLRKRHNKIKARIKHGVERPGDFEKLKSIRQRLGYETK